ncbi:hypothetical protein D9615_004163 [Tricholomella constricta]|uniref:HORMA domain-containing protein n=1 Tax=Tricholomella constricta TaxID=117010 RepID=A0A8H5HCV2_9AGAR|nr:hypothetical protein D9615_004163 [Tricholomella constricta]
MTLGDASQKKNSRRRADNPVTEAAKKGKPPTLSDVKKSVKALLKTLIQATTQMDVLPKRRFATFKLFYTDKTPADYEPPHFQTGDEEKDKWFFMTHDLDEVPDKWRIGKVDTGHHSVNLSVTSIATYLPSSTQHDNAVFGGTTSRPPAGLNLTPVQEASLRAAQAEQQVRDAQERMVAWSGEEAVETDDADGEGEDDPDYEKLPDGSYRRVASDGAGNLIPSGIRNNETGNIEPLSGPMDVEEAYFGGVPEIVPTRLSELNLDREIGKSNIEQTQVIADFTQDVSLPSPVATNQHHSRSSSLSADKVFDSGPDLNDTNWAPPTMSPITSTIFDQESDTDMEILKDTPASTLIKDTETLNMETQMESIESFGQVESAVEDIDAGELTPKRAHVRKLGGMVDNGLQCECGISVEDECCFCEGGCGRWYHVWCMGYHSIEDPRMPAEFCCFSCRIQADPFWPLIKVDLYPIMLSRFQELAIFRHRRYTRAIKTAETHRPENSTEFAKAYGKFFCGGLDFARQLFKRLETAGFIIEQSTTLDDLGFAQTHEKNAKGGRKTKTKQPKNRKNVQKAKYQFKREALQSTQYLDYFNPDPSVESLLMKFAELTSHLKPHRKALDADLSNAATLQLAQISLEEPQTETQTQAETQTLSSMYEPGLKRSNVDDDDDTPKSKKKMKISVTDGLDLAE